jgi:Ca2+-binding EF-hand superfamily protein
MAPEVLLKSYTSQCDLWSLGVASFVLVFGYMPFSGSDKRQAQSIKAAKFQVRRQAFKAAASDAKAFVQALLVADPDLRPSAEQALAHPWMVAARRGTATVPLHRGVVDALHDFGQAPAFHRAVLMMVAWSLTSEERGKVSEAFLKMDVSHCGAIKPSEFKRLLQGQFQIAGAQADELFEALDVLGAGEIRYSSFLAAAAPSQIGLHENLLRATFRRFDADATGTVTQDNLRDVLGESFGGQEVGGMLEEIHTSQPGQVSRDEFVAHFCSTGCCAAASKGLMRAAAIV